MRPSVVRVVKAKNVRKGSRLFVAGWEGEDIVKPKWREVTDVSDPNYDGRTMRLTWGDGLDDWETLDDDERVLVIE